MRSPSSATCFDAERGARRLRLEIEPAPGVKAKLLNDYMAAGQHAWLLPDLAFAGEAWAVVRLRVPSTAPAGEGHGEGLAAICSFSARYVTLDGEPRAIQPFALALPTLPASAFHAIAEDELVARCARPSAPPPTTRGWRSRSRSCGRSPRRRTR